MANKKNDGGGGNPMSYFSDGYTRTILDNGAPVFKKQSIAERLDCLVAGMIGMKSLKEFILSQKRTMIWNEKRENIGMSAIKDESILVLTGAGDKDQTIRYLTKFYKITNRVQTEKTYDLSLETISSYWPDTTRRNFKDAKKEAQGRLIVVRDLGKALSSTVPEYEYTRYYATQFIAKLAKEGYPIVVLSSTQTLQQWRSLCEGVDAIQKQVIPVEKYSADDLAKKFFRYADADGYVYTHALRLKIKDIFQVVQSPDFAKINTNTLARNVYKVCQERQCQRLWNIPEDKQNVDLMRSFTKEDIVRFIVPCQGDVVIV